MYIFIDESGIHKTIGHSTFVLVYVETKNYFLLEEQIRTIEKDLGIAPFHWSDYGSKQGWQVRRKFIERISKLDFYFKVALVENPTNVHNSFEFLLEHLVIEKHIKAIIIDGKKTKSYLRQIKKVLRDKGISVRKIRSLNDKAAGALGLADALAGLMRVYFDNPTEEVKYMHNLIKNKITALLEGGQNAW